MGNQKIIDLSSNAKIWRDTDGMGAKVIKCDGDLVGKRNLCTQKDLDDSKVVIKLAGGLLTRAV